MKAANPQAKNLKNQGGLTRMSPLFLSEPGSPHDKGKLPIVPLATESSSSFPFSTALGASLPKHLYAPSLDRKTQSESQVPESWLVLASKYLPPQYSDTQSQRARVHFSRLKSQKLDCNEKVVPNLADSGFLVLRGLRMRIGHTDGAFLICRIFRGPKTAFRINSKGQRPGIG